MAWDHSFSIDGIDKISFSVHEDTEFPEYGNKYFVRAEYSSPFEFCDGGGDTVDEATKATLLKLAAVLTQMQMAVLQEYTNRVRNTTE